MNARLTEAARYRWAGALPILGPVLEPAVRYRSLSWLGPVLFVPQVLLRRALDRCGVIGTASAGR